MTPDDAYITGAPEGLQAAMGLGAIWALEVAVLDQRDGGIFGPDDVVVLTDRDGESVGIDGGD